MLTAGAEGATVTVVPGLGSEPSKHADYHRAMPHLPVSHKPIDTVYTDSFTISTLREG